MEEVEKEKAITKGKNKKVKKVQSWKSCQSPDGSGFSVTINVHHDVQALKRHFRVTNGFKILSMKHRSHHT